MTRRRKILITAGALAFGLIVVPAGLHAKKPNPADYKLRAKILSTSAPSGGGVRFTHDAKTGAITGYTPGRGSAGSTTVEIGKTIYTLLGDVPMSEVGQSYPARIGKARGLIGVPHDALFLLFKHSGKLRVRRFWITGRAVAP